MQLLDFYPCQGWFAPGELIRLALNVLAEEAGTLTIQLTITDLDQAVAEISSNERLLPGANQLELAWQPPPTIPAGYGAAIRIWDKQGVQMRQTAFDVLADWTAFPRYGFVCDFSPRRSDADAVLEHLLPYHINGLQFYDWQYRHDNLLAPTDEYLDPLGRELSLDTIRSLIAAAHNRKMAAMPYLAVYAASAKFWREHADWALYDQDGQTIPFGEDFLGLMNPVPGGPWSQHLLAECARVLQALPFDGVHIDQYGEPHHAWDAHGLPVDLPQAFAAFLGAVREEFPNKCALFNAVGNWPIEALTAAPASFEYIEVWPPDTGYSDLARIVAEARRLSGGRPVAIAHYLPAERLANNLLAEAVIFANGGGRISLGEDARLLADPYFPKHQALGPHLAADLRRFYDFAVRYGRLTGPQAAAVPELRLKVLEGVRAFPRQAGQWLALHLVNFSGLGPVPRWDTDHGAPQTQRELPLEIGLPASPKRVLWASPEQPDLQSVAFEFSTGRLKCRVPFLRWWSTLIVEI